MTDECKTESRRGNTREKLLSAAITLLAEHGYSGATTGRIARAVGIKQPSFYAHFSSQDACIAEAIRYEGEALATRLRERRAGLPQFSPEASGDHVRMGFWLLLTYMQHRPDFARVLHRLLDDDSLAGEAVREVMSRIRDELVADLPRFGVEPAPDAALRVEMLIAMVGQADRGLRWGEYELEAVVNLLTEYAGRLFGD